MEGYALDNLSKVIINTLRGSAKMKRFALQEPCCALGQMVLTLLMVQKRESHCKIKVGTLHLHSMYNVWPIAVT